MNKSKADLIPYWKVWPGKNSFCCGGNCVIAPERGTFYYTYFLIFIPSILFFVFVAPHIWERFSPATVIITAFLILHSVISLSITASMDPGIIPRNEERRTFAEALEASKNVMGMKPPIIEVVLGGERMTLKYCDTCHIFRPPRASHCSYCDNCVENFDHHCPWTGNCIGRRNYKYFMWFLLSTSLMLLYVFSLSVAVIVVYILDNQSSNAGVTFIDAIRFSPVSLLLVIYCFMVFLSLMGLTGMHVYLIFVGKTTHEHLKGTWKEEMSPYNDGCSANWRKLLCGPIYPSLIEGTLKKYISRHHDSLGEDEAKHSAKPLLRHKSEKSEASYV